MCIRVVTIVVEGESSVNGSIVGLFHSPDLVSNDTTSTVDKISATTVLLPAGTYLIDISYKWNTQQVNAHIETEFLLDSSHLTVGDGLDHDQRVSSGGGDWGGTGSRCRQPFYTRYPVTFDSDATHELLLRFKSGNNGRTVSMWDALITITRVS